jgi:hypothetical protein
MGQKVQGRRPIDQRTIDGSRRISGGNNCKMGKETGRKIEVQSAS